MKSNESDQLMACDHCREKVPSDTTSTCITAHVELLDYDLDCGLECPPDYFYCKCCVNKHGFCKDCAKAIPENLQKKISDDFNR